jgi:hypothetical protein
MVRLLKEKPNVCSSSSASSLFFLLLLLLPLRLKRGAPTRR